MYLVLFSFLLLNYIVLSIIEPIRKSVYLEAEAQLLTIDLAGWQIAGQLDPVAQLDYMRAAREEWMDNDSWREFDS